MSRLLTDVANLAGYDEPVTAPNGIGYFAYRTRICRAVAKLDAPRSSATVGKPPAITDSSLVWMLPLKSGETAVHVRRFTDGSGLVRYADLLLSLIHI